MRDTLFKRVVLPTFGPGIPTRAVSVAKGTDVAVRVVVKNTSGSTAFFSHSQTDLQNQNGPTTNVFEVVGGETEVFVLAPEQKLYGLGAGAGVLITLTISDALPIL